MAGRKLKYYSITGSYDLQTWDSVNWDNSGLSWDTDTQKWIPTKITAGDSLESLLDDFYPSTLGKGVSGALYTHVSDGSIHGGGSAVTWNTLTASTGIHGFANEISVSSAAAQTIVVEGYNSISSNALSGALLAGSGTKYSENYNWYNTSSNQYSNWLGSGEKISRWYSESSTKLSDVAYSAQIYTTWALSGEKLSRWYVESSSKLGEVAASGFKWYQAYQSGTKALPESLLSNGLVKRSAAFTYTAVTDNSTQWDAIVGSGTKYSTSCQRIVDAFNHDLYITSSNILTNYYPSSLGKGISSQVALAYASAQIALYEAGAAGNLSTLVIDANKDWNSKYIANLGGISSTRVATPSLWGGGMAGNNMEFAKLEYLSDSTWGLTFNDGQADFVTTFKGKSDSNLLVIGSINFPDTIGIGTNTPSYKLEVNGGVYGTGISSQYLSGGIFQLSGGVINSNTISGLSTPLWPSSASNKKYVDDKILASSIEDLVDVAIMTPELGDVLTWDNTNSVWSSQASQGGVTYISSCTDGLNITGWTSGQVLTWIGETNKWVNKYAPLTFSIANTQVSANSYLNLARFETGTKICYVLQASCCHSGGTSLSGLRVKVVDDDVTIYDTSSSSLEQGGPLAKSNANSNMQIRFMYSGTANVVEGGVAGYKYGSAFVQVALW